MTSIGLLTISKTMDNCKEKFTWMTVALPVAFMNEVFFKYVLNDIKGSRENVFLDKNMYLEEL